MMAEEQSLHILVAEDEPEAARMMADYLESKGYRVSLANDGIAAIELQQRDPADLVITDIRMPRLGGLEIISELRADAPALPIIVVTGIPLYSDPEELTEGPFAVLRKPISLRDLVEEVARLIGTGLRSRAVPERP